MRVDENRIATRLVKCETELKSDMDYDLFGWAVGEAVGVEVPVITGLGKLTQTQIIKMNIELNTGGQVRMCHVPGLTPEAPTVEHALKGQKPVETIKITREDLKKVYEKMNYASNENVDFVYFGCPFYSLGELRRVVYYLEGRNVELTSGWWLTTGPSKSPKKWVIGTSSKRLEEYYYLEHVHALEQACHQTRT